jgi:NitT/TauT family transport system substrate-binding protein
MLLPRREALKTLAASAAAPAFLAAPAIRRSAFADEARKITFVKQHGLPYLPLMVAEKLRLVEKHSEKAGVPGVTPEYQTLGGTASLIDALLAGAMNFGIVGVPAVATLWSKTAGTPSEVRALSAVQSMPYYLVTHREGLKSIADIGPQDRIALPAAKVSAQAITLQMEAAKVFGEASFAKLDAQTISRAHPDAATAILSRSTEITCHFAAAPFYQIELAEPANRSILRSYDTFGGTKTNGVLLMTKAFRDANPKVTRAVYEALDEANTFIGREPRQAADVYIDITGEKRIGAPQMERIVADPENVWTTTPAKAMQWASFMHKVGTIKKIPASWKDLFMPECHELAGS